MTGSHALWGCLQSSKKNGFHHRAQLCPKSLPSSAQMTSKKPVKCKSQRCGTVSWNWCLLLRFMVISGKKEAFLFSLLNEATATLIERLIKGCGRWLQNSTFLSGGKKRKKKPFVEVRENVSILVFCITYFCFLSNPPHSCSIHRLLYRNKL